MKLAAFQKKIVYILAMVVILVVLFVLGLPQTESRGGVVRRGGILSQLRETHGIGQAHLGQVDPASESMKLATLGLRGVAAAILWHKSNYYNREQYWDRLSATLNQIALIEPHHVSVWESQSHNLAYNIAAQFDDYHQKYEWLKKGISYLIRGTKYNKRQPQLLWGVGRDIGQKIGISDEKLLYRKLFREDDEFHKYLEAQGMNQLENEALGYDRRPDHWLVGRLWYNKSYALVDSGESHRMKPANFFSTGPKCLLRYSEAIEEEGILDDRAKFAWSRAGEQWHEFGNRDLPTMWGFPVRMNGLDLAYQRIAEEEAAFERLTPGIKQQLIEQRRAQLTEEERIAIDLPLEDRTPDQRIIAMTKGPLLQPSPRDIAEAAPAAVRIKAMEQAAKIEEARFHAAQVEDLRTDTNFEYWETRAEAEQNDVTLAARQQIFAADQLMDKAENDAAIQYYSAAMKNWAKVFRFYPKLIEDELADQVVKAIKRYYNATLDEPTRPDFPLAKFLQYKEQLNPSLAGNETTLQAIRNEWSNEAARLRREGIRLTEADIETPQKTE